MVLAVKMLSSRALQGGVGAFAIKLLKLLGANVTAITTKLNEEGFLKMIGADEIISKKIL